MTRSDVLAAFMKRDPSLAQRMFVSDALERMRSFDRGSPEGGRTVWHIDVYSGRRIAGTVYSEHSDIDWHRFGLDVPEEKPRESFEDWLMRTAKDQARRQP